MTRLPSHTTANGMELSRTTRQTPKRSQLKEILKRKQNIFPIPTVRYEFDIGKC